MYTFYAPKIDLESVVLHIQLPNVNNCILNPRDLKQKPSGFLVGP